MKEFLNTFKTPIFTFSVVMIHLLYILVFLNVAFFNPEYIENLNFLLNLFISLFLIIRFSFYHSNSLSSFDKRVIISSGTILLLNTLITGIFNKYFPNMQPKFQTYFDRYLHK